MVHFNSDVYLFIILCILNVAFWFLGHLQHLEYWVDSLEKADVIMRLVQSSNVPKLIREDQKHIMHFDFK